MRNIIGVHVFDTAISHCGIAWTADAIAGVRLPETDLADMRRRYGEAPDANPLPFVLDVITRIRRHLTGHADDLRDIPCTDSSVSEFDARVYAITRTIAPGQTRTYGDIARELGDPLLARAVGQALGRNPFPILVPCHRVLAAGGKTGGFTAPGGIDTKFQILAIEEAHMRQQDSLFETLPLAIKPRSER